MTTERVNHPAHYGGESNRFEAIKIIEGWGLGFAFCIGNALKYICRAPHKGTALEDMRKALWYLDRAAGDPNPHWPAPLYHAESAFMVTTAWQLPPALIQVVYRIREALQYRDLGLVRLAADQLRTFLGSAG